VALFVLAFSEASFFPVPPDVLLIALALGASKKSFRFAAICTAGSILGACAGYAIGWAAAPLAKGLIAQLAGIDAYYQVADAYGKNAFLTVAVAGFTPIPYKVFTLSAGIFHESVGLATLLLASLLSRTARFFLVAGLIFFFGSPVKRIIDRYFNLLALAFGVLLVAGFILLGGVGTGPLAVEPRVRVHLQELTHPDPELRVEAIGELRRLAAAFGSPPAFGYDPAAPLEDSSEAVQRWKAWWEEALKRAKDTKEDNGS